MSAAVGRLPKPNLIHIQRKWLLKHLYISIGLGIAGATAFEMFVMGPRRKKLHDFYLTYDPFEDFERMRKLGLFQSCPPDDPPIKY